MENRSRNILLGFVGIGALCVLCACVGAFFAPRAAMYVAGFRDGQDTDEFLGDLSDGSIVIDETGATVTGNPVLEVAPTPVTVIEELDQVTVELDGQQGTVDLNALGVDRAEKGTDADGSEVYYFEYDESSINQIFQTAVWPQAPAEVTNQVQNVSIDLRSNAVVLNGQADIGFGMQDVAVILAIDANQAKFTVAGIEVGGLVFETPPGGPIGEYVTLIETEGNRALDELVLYGSGGTPLSVQHIAVENGQLRITAE